MGKLVIIEGIDGSGKTTISKQLNDILSTMYKSIYINRKNFEVDSVFVNKFMSNIKKSLWESTSTDPINEIDEEGWLYIHMLWYHLFQKNYLEPMLEQYDYVIMDGWFYKFWARHLTNGGVDIDYSKQIISRLCKGDIVFYLKVNPDVCFYRKENCNQAELGILGDTKGSSPEERFVDYQSKVQIQYEQMSRELKFVDLDANCKITYIIEQIIDYLEKDASR
ncbi:MAG: dTMP kinase [Lacrimispora saccharolytica]